VRDLKRIESTGRFALKSGRVTEYIICDLSAMHRVYGTPGKSRSSSKKCYCKTTEPDHNVLKHKANSFFLELGVVWCCNYFRTGLVSA